MSNEGYAYYDFHLHSNGSVDSRAEPSKIIEIARERRLNGLALTDHDTLKGHEEMRPLLPENNGFMLFDASAEITTRMGKSSKKDKTQFPHILAINIPPGELDDFLRRHPFPKMNPLKFRYKHLKALAPTEEVLEWIGQFPDSLAVSAHPSREGNISSLSFDQIKRFSGQGLLEAVEVFNYGPRKHDVDRFVMAQKLGLAMLGDSDAHKAKKVGKVVTRISGLPESTEEVIYRIKQLQCEPYIPEYPGYLEEIRAKARIIYDRRAA